MRALDPELRSTELRLRSWASYALPTPGALPVAPLPGWPRQVLATHAAVEKLLWRFRAALYACYSGPPPKAAEAIYRQHRETLRPEGKADAGAYRDDLSIARCCVRGLLIEDSVPPGRGGADVGA